MRSTEILALLAQYEGSYLLDELGPPHRNDIKARTVTVKTADGRDIAWVGGDVGSQVIDDLIRARLVYDAVPLDENYYSRIYRLMPDGLKRGKAV